MQKWKPRTEQVRNRHIGQRHGVERTSKGRDAASPGLTPIASDLLDLQRLAGNRAVTSRVLALQRMPTREAVVKVLGAPSRLPTESRKYKRVLSAIEAYHKYLTKPLVMGAFQKQFADLIRLLGHIRDNAQEYSNVTGAKATYMKGTLATEVAQEQALVNKTLIRLLTEPVDYAFTPTLRNLLLTHVGRTAPTPALDDRDIVGNQRGGSSEVTEYARPDGTRAFFKPGKEMLETRDDEEILGDLKQSGLSDEDQFLAYNSLVNERVLAVEAVGIDPTDARMGNRDTAMYRLSRLLSEDVIARAQRAVKSDGTTGSLMDKAKGASGKQLMGQGRFAKSASEQRPGEVNQRDPELMRLMSKLQVIDLLAYQIDRNPANYWIQLDPDTGEVTGITGIDNDLALGRSTGVDRREQQLPGFSRYVDKELAQRILSLDLALLPAVFGDLLSPAEIDALIIRFEQMRAKLKEKSTRLLKPDEWNDAVAKGLLDENKSYWADIEQHKFNYGPRD